MTSLSVRQVKKRGLKVESKDPTGGLIEPIDPKTGKKMPARLLIPDPGFDFNPGKTAFKSDISKYPAWLRKQIKEELSK